VLGLSLEKLVVLAVIAAFVLGPHRLPHYAQRLGELVRSFRSFVEAASERTRAELGGDLSDEEWRRLDPRHYDPRTIVRRALAEEPDPDTSPAPPIPDEAPPRRPRYDSAGRRIRTPA
jgi:sec-independent protein translocase protein TatB